MSFASSAAISAASAAISKALALAASIAFDSMSPAFTSSMFASLAFFRAAGFSCLLCFLFQDGTLEIRDGISSRGKRNSGFAKRWGKNERVTRDASNAGSFRLDW